MKYAWIKKHRKIWPITLQCDVLGVSVSGYFDKQNRDKASNKPPGRVSNEALLAHIKAIASEVKDEYGWPRIWKALLTKGVRVGKERVRKLMQLHGIRARGKRKFVTTTDSKHNLPVAANLLDRQFQVDQPNRVWSTDITYVATAEGWLYLTVVIDLFNRQIVGWAVADHMRVEFVMEALRMAWFRRHPESGLIFHSDRGSQYCSHEFQRALKAYGMISSMSRKGNCWDNAPTESLWGSLKVGRLHGQRFATHQAAKEEIMDWLHFYNHKRLHSTLNYQSPMQFEKCWYADQLKLAA
jgi:transposase InsO family protein